MKGRNAAKIRNADKVYVDTSAYLAVLNADDEGHPRAREAWSRLIRGGVPLVSCSYVLVETCAVLQNRLGMEAARVFLEDIFPLLQVEWVDSFLNAISANTFLTVNRRRVSLVDCASFTVMRRLNIKKAFAFDKHFAEQGFELIVE